MSAVMIFRAVVQLEGQHSMTRTVLRGVPPNHRDVGGHDVMHAAVAVLLVGLNLLSLPNSTR